MKDWINDFLYKYGSSLSYLAYFILMLFLIKLAGRM